MFNKYVWELYNESKHGTETIKFYTELTPEGYDKETDAGVQYELEIPEALRSNFSDDVAGFNIIEATQLFGSTFKIGNIEEATKLFNNIVSKGIPLRCKGKNGRLYTVETFGGKTYESEIYMYIDWISLGLYFAHNDCFLPYLFNSIAYQHYEGFQFYNLEEICVYFNIPLPTIPGKRSQVEKAKYYGKINHALYEFRVLNGMTPGEMCAFLYDFALNMTEKSISDELPRPSKAWILKSKIDFEFLDNAKSDSLSRWDGNPDTRIGDILLIYCMTPRKYIHSIWRAHSDGFVDPFFYYHNIVVIGSPTKTELVEFKDLKNDPVLSKMGAVKAHMQGAGGYALTAEQYNAVLEIMKKKGQDISILPRIEPVTYSEDIEIDNEKDVERLLVEPFLMKLEFSENDWIRQMPIKMGRGERYYPDYAIFANPKRGEESAKMILEAKYQISGNRELVNAFYQAKSYALRLRSNFIILASREGIWLYPNVKGNFKTENYDHKNWAELSDPDVFHKILSRIGKKKLIKPFS